MTEADSAWSGFHRGSLGRPARELLRRTLGCFDLERRPPGVAVDLGCGSGAETLDLLRRGWQVHAVDADANGIAMLKESVPPTVQPLLHTHVGSFEAFEFPRCDLGWAGFSLPYFAAVQWLPLWSRIVTVLNVNARFAGDIFGDKHAWAVEPQVQVLTESALRRQLEGLIVEAFDIKDGLRPSGGELTRWNAFGIAARKPAARA